MTQKPVYARLFGKIILTLENCLLPEDKLAETPSQHDGLDRETETDLRILGCELIQTAGILLKLPQVAMATGQVLFQRFFYSKSFVRHSMETTAMSCICLASKIEEAPRRIRDVINVFYHIKQVRAQKTITPMILDPAYIAMKTQVIKAERRVLKELGFCVHVKHPHKLIVMYLQMLGYEKNEKLMQIAWNYMNDSLRTDVFVRYQPETIACACIYLTARKLNFPLPNNPSWFSIFKVTEESILDVSYRISSLYRRAKPNVETLEQSVEELKKTYMESRHKNRGQGVNTPPATTTVDRSNGGSHNAWGGFISRTLPATNLTTVATGAGGGGGAGSGNVVTGSNSTGVVGGDGSGGVGGSGSGGTSAGGNGGGGNNSGVSSSGGGTNTGGNGITTGTINNNTNNNSGSGGNDTKTVSISKRSNSRSRSRSRSHNNSEDDRDYSRTRKKSRHRSRTPVGKYSSNSNKKKSSRNYSRSPSTSPAQSKHIKKRSDRKTPPRDKSDYYSNGGGGGGNSGNDRDRMTSKDRDRQRDGRVGSSGGGGNNKDRDRERDRSSKHDRYSSNSNSRSSGHRSTKHRERSRDRKR